MSDVVLAALMKRIASGDRGAFAQLYREMESPLYRFVSSRLNDQQRSSDITHDVFLQVWRDAGAFEGRSKVRTWLFAMAYRKVVDVYRRENRLVFGEDVPESADESPNPEACVLAMENRDAVRQCLETLSPSHRAAIELTFMEDMSYPEVAEITGVPEGTVKSRVFHAKQLLLRCLSTKLGMKRDDQ
ncbi:sigma-70 family RNA polymerase sigma factor [Tabrizicola sp. KVB23]|uniref:Sigma-70 family RNA polymerase sigma factor n=2 Tax=Fuscibacter oryzae TaxID=2803939 RepID=A0A8J7MNW5_9RHOB|nr:sigma-70 family RNA polymerase sigma factor [Fuscibacter oryzae]